MNEEELKKGCGKKYVHSQGYDICGEHYGDGSVALCPNCSGKLEGFQKGKLEICYNLLNSFEKRIKDIEELPINHHLKIEQMNFLAGMREITKEIYILIESIEQLQKEIGGMK